MRGRLLPYTYVLVQLRMGMAGIAHLVGRPRTVSLSILSEDYTYIEVIDRIYAAFGKTLSPEIRAEIEDAIKPVEEAVHKRIRACNGNPLTQRLNYFNRPRIDVENCIALGAIGKVCQKIQYQDFLQYKEEIQEHLIRWHQARELRAKKWLDGRGYRPRKYQPGDPGSAFPGRTPLTWKRRVPYAHKGVVQRGRRVLSKPGR